MLDKTLPESDVSLKTLDLLTGSIFDSGTKIWIEPKKVIIETFYPNKISAEWQNYCEVEAAMADGQKFITPARRT